MSATVATPHPAATVALVRDAPGGLEVLLLQRSHNLRFMPGAYVFPGGSVDEADGSPAMRAMCSGLDDESASRALGVERGGLAYWVAAIREAFEEAGILLTYDRSRAIVNLDSDAERYRTHRGKLHKRHGDFGSILLEEKLSPAVDRLTYFGHWITPVTVPRRYDTRFFLAVLPERQEVMHDNHETIAHRWLRPQQALDARDELGLRFPTIRTLEEFVIHDTTSTLVAALRSKRIVSPMLVRTGHDGRQLLPGEPGYEEAEKVGR